MLRLLAPKLPLRTIAPSLSNIVLDGGKSRVIFNDAISSQQFDTCSQSPYLVINYLPPAPDPPADVDLPNSSLCPPYHIHLREDETFHVILGEANFLLASSQARQIIIKEGNSQNAITKHSIASGEKFTIRRGLIHTFRNASRTEPLVLEFGFSSPDSNVVEQDLNAKMKRFFLNTQLYRSDCHSQKIPRSLLQVLLFNYHADVALVPSWLLNVHSRYPSLRTLIERFLAPNLGRLMNFWGGIVLGQCLMGLKSSYEEYYPSTKPELLTDGDRLQQQKGSPSTAENTEAKFASGESEDNNTDQTSDRDVASQYACQAWRNHSFDGQDEKWRP